MKSCLIVDDDVDLREGLAELLEDEGCTVDTAGDAEGALEKFTRKSYDVTLLDMKLPGVDGMELLQQIRDNPNTGKIFLVSGNPDVHKALDETGLLDTVSGVIAKPFSIEEMMDLIKTALK